MNKLEEKGLELIKINNSNRGTEYLDRTIYYERDVEQEDGTFKKEVRIYAKIGSWISPKMMKKALLLEKENWELNCKERRKMEESKIKWCRPIRQITPHFEVSQYFEDEYLKIKEQDNFKASTDIQDNLFHENETVQRLSENYRNKKKND